MWLSANKLKLNLSKCKYIIFHHPQKKMDNIGPLIKINNSPIEKVSQFDFLGLTLDETLTWKPHINKISNKISRTTGLLNRLKNHLPSYILKTIYNSIILSHINYCITLWGFNQQRVFKLQKKSIRIISKTTYNSHTSPLFKRHDLLKINDLFNLSCLKVFHKFLNNKLPSYFNNFFTFSSHHYFTRSKRPLQPYCRTTLAKKCLKNYVPKLISTTPEVVASKIYSHSLEGFSHYFKAFNISNYQDTCDLNNCYICSR